MIHPTAIIDPKAKIADNVAIGPYSIIGPYVSIDSETVVGPHVVINGPCRIGKKNQFFQFASIGEIPQDKKFQGEETYLEIGDNNIFRESCTINRGTAQGGGATRIGNDNLFMAYVHIAHDCKVGNGTIFANNASLSGHVTIDDYAILSGFCAVRQFTYVGAYSFVAGGTMVVKDVLPYTLVSGDPAMPYGLNSVGLQRHGYSPETILNLKRAYKVIYRQGLTSQESLEKLNGLAQITPEVEQLIKAIERAERGIAR
ncbi:MAG: acyl-[acyl-carrier-protein]--UDP-N-acetylglucosamine O-acyltransferase [Legionellales bacterium]|nr:acyl-[acyl-carrier-protein]--UDP-N-acetylglucosamine O-acyltransferase [Legionellales bacterium]